MKILLEGCDGLGKTYATQKITEILKTLGLDNFAQVYDRDELITGTIYRETLPNRDWDIFPKLDTLTAKKYDLTIILTASDRFDYTAKKDIYTVTELKKINKAYIDYYDKNKKRGGHIVNIGIDCEKDVHFLIIFTLMNIFSEWVYYGDN